MVPPESSQNSTPQNEINAAEEDVNNYEGFMDALTSGTNQGLIIFLNVLAGQTLGTYTDNKNCLLYMHLLDF